MACETAEWDQSDGLYKNNCCLPIIAKILGTNGKIGLLRPLPLPPDPPFHAAWIKFHMTLATLN